MSEKYKQMQERLARVDKDNQERQRPIMEKAMLNFATVAGTLSNDPSKPQVPQLPEGVQKFIVDQFNNTDNPELAGFLATVSNKFDEANGKMKEQLTLNDGYQKQNATLQQQLQETRALLEKQSAVLAEQNRQTSPNLPQQSSVLTDIFQKAQSTPLDALFGKRSYESAFPNSSIAENVFNQIKPGEMITQESSKNPEPNAKRSKVDDLPVGVMPSHHALFQSLSGMKSTVNMRNPQKKA
jgi:hypothetical protein